MTLLNSYILTYDCPLHGIKGNTAAFDITIQATEGMRIADAIFIALRNSLAEYLTEYLKQKVTLNKINLTMVALVNSIQL